MCDLQFLTILQYVSKLCVPLVKWFSFGVVDTWTHISVTEFDKISLQRQKVSNFKLKQKMRENSCWKSVCRKKSSWLKQSTRRRTVTQNLLSKWLWSNIKCNICQSSIWPDKNFSTMLSFSSWWTTQGHANKNESC